MTITTNTTLIRVFLNQDTEVKKLKKKRYLVKVMLDNGIVIQMNDVPVEINDDYIDFKLNNGNQLIAKQLVDAAIAVLVKTPSSVTIKVVEDKQEQEDITMNNETNKNSENEVNETVDNSVIAESIYEEVLEAQALFEEKLAKFPEMMEINRQGVEQLKASCNKISQEAEAVISGKSNDKSTLDTVNVNTASTPEKEESLLYTTAKVAGKAVGLAAIGYVGYLAYGFIKNKLSN